MRLEIRGLKGFDWDHGNWRKSEEKHGVAASEAEEALLGNPIVRVDPLHSTDEQRFVALGRTDAGRRLFLSFTIRRSRVRVISARPMSRREREMYEKAEKPGK